MLLTSEFGKNANGLHGHIFAHSPADGFRHKRHYNNETLSEFGLVSGRIGKSSSGIKTSRTVPLSDRRAKRGN